MYQVKVGTYFICEDKRADCFGVARRTAPMPVATAAGASTDAPIRTLVFDIDDTLYSDSSGMPAALWDALRRYMHPAVASMCAKPACLCTAIAGGS